MAYQQNQQPGFTYGQPDYLGGHQQGYHNNPCYPGYPPNNPGYPPNNPGYPPNNPGYPPNNPGYPPNNQGYPPNNPGYPPNNPGYPPNNQGYPPNNQGYPPNNPGYPPNNQGYPPNNRSYPQYPGSPAGDNPGAAEQVLDAAALDNAGKKSKKKKNSEEDKKIGFDDKSIRRGFIRKVYSILFFQLLITCAVISLFLYHEPTQRYVSTHSEIFWYSLGTLLIAIILMSCCTNIRRAPPLNYIFLVVFTAAESVLMGLTASTFNADVVLIAAGITLGICLLLTLFAFQTKIDFTFLSGALFVGVFIVVVCGIIAACVPSKGMLTLYAGIGVLLFSLFLVYDTQLIIGGKHQDGISPEEYIFAALSLYLDVMRIFSYILLIFGICKK